MDSSTRVVQEFLVAMKPIQEAFNEFVRELYRRPEVKLVHVYHPLLYPDSDFGVSADLHNGAGLDFWIELETSGATWAMIYSVQRRDPNEDGTHCEAHFPPQKIELAMDLPRAVLAAVQVLRQRGADDTLFR